MKYAITMVKTDYRKDGKKWVEQRRDVELIDKETYYNITESRDYFHHLGFFERHNKSYTPMGYVVTSINTIDPDKNQKSLREFDIQLKKRG